MKLLKSRAGFSLLELLIVMAVMAVITSIALPSFRGMRNEAWVTKAENEVETLKTAIKSYYRHHNEIPRSLNYLYTASPTIVKKALQDPFHTYGNTYKYVYNFGKDGTDQPIYIIVSRGADGIYVAPTVKNNGTNQAYILIKKTSDDIVASNVPVVRE